MRIVEIAVAIAAAFLVQTLGARYFPPIREYVDLFLIVAAAFGLKEGRLVGLGAGTVAGLVQDAFSGGMLGVNGISKTTVGYVSGLAGRRLILRGWPGRFLFFTLAAAVDLAILAAIAHAVGKPAVVGEGSRPVYFCLINGIIGVFALRLLERIQQRR